MFGDDQARLSGSYTGDAAATVLSASGEALNRDAAAAGLSLLYTPDPAWAIRLGYQDAFAPDTTQHGLLARLSTAW